MPRRLSTGPVRAGNASCPGCGALYPSSAGPTHEYIGASSGCWAVYGQVLAKEYSDDRYMRAHRRTVDAYAAQHPGEPSRRSIQSVAVHLVGLYVVNDLEMDGDSALRAVRRASDGSNNFTWLEPPESTGDMTVQDVAAAGDPDEHCRLVAAWAKSVWAAWRDHHATIRRWAAM